MKRLGSLLSGSIALLASKLAYSAGAEGLSQAYSAIDKLNSSLSEYGGSLVVGQESIELILHEKISFEFAEDSFTQAETVKALAEFIKVMPEGIFVRVTGHTDSVGKAVDNQDLGLRRASRVMFQLVESGVSPSRIIVGSKGEQDQLVESKGSKLANRRVEIELISRLSP